MPIHDRLPYLPAMRHLKVDQPPGNEPQDPAKHVADDGHQQLEPWSELDDCERLELACRKVASCASPAEPYRTETIDSPLSPHYLHSTTSSLFGIGTGTQSASVSLGQSFFRFSLSNDAGDPGSASPPGHSPTFNNDWIKDVEPEVATADETSIQPAVASGRGEPLEVQRQLKHVSKRDPVTPKKALVRCYTRQ
jgi:hypothetical protein